MTTKEPMSEMRARIEQLAMGYGLSSILFAAVELGLFDQLADGPLDTESLARRLGASPSGVARLTAALGALNLVAFEADGRVSAPPELVAMLSRDRDDSLAPVLLYHQRHVAPLMGQLGNAVRHKRPQIAGWPFASPGAADRHCYEELSRHPEEYRLFLQAMDRFAMGTGTDIAASFDLRNTRRLIDVGGGSGRIARELLAAAPDLTIEMLDLPIACRMAEKEALAAGLGGRFRATEADLTKAFPRTIEPADVVLLAGILADWGPDDQLRILANVAPLLRPGGCLVVNETLLDEGRKGPMVPVMLSVLMLVAMPGDSFTLTDLTALLQKGGYSSIEHRPPRQPGRRDLVIARC
ncbi:MAG TPA: methyltransferase [Labilithrix sp.]|nr:methyltransferase [Labilithrix sp.]